MTLDSGIVPDIFDTSKPHKCPFDKNPRSCTCPTCGWARDFVRARASLARAEDRNFGRNREGGGTTFGALRAPEPPPQPQESPREKQERQRRERYKESDRVWAQVQAEQAELRAKKQTPAYGNDPDFIKGYVEHSENKDLSGLLSLTPAASAVDSFNAAKDFIINPSLGSAAMIGVAMIPGKCADELVEKAVENSRSLTEAIGKTGMEEAKKRLGMVTDSRYIDRYHGPDDIVRDKSNKLTEIEAKGTSTGSTNVTKNTSLEMQGSARKNLRRSNQMRKKSNKVGVDSTRQGGEYTQEELDLWNDINRLKGNKRHISTHTHTETGKVTVIERDMDGNIAKEIDTFTIDNFDTVKSGIEERLSK